MAKRRVTDAAAILHRRYIKGRSQREASLRVERVNADVAQLVYDQRRAAGLTQSELAVLLDTTQSVVSRLEDANYRGHSLSMLSRIATALNLRLTVAMEHNDGEG